ncbi:MAG: hypothetical protein IT481_08430 [Gammaproteobacteria bacterium]|nr:hypothetical protein [Gammaproteobacteria bacterium]
MPQLKLVEPVPVDDDLCTGMAIEPLDSWGARFVMYARQTCYEAGGVEFFVVKRKIVLPMAAIRPCVDTTMTFLQHSDSAQILRLV